MRSGFTTATDSHGCCGRSHYVRSAFMSLSIFLRPSAQRDSANGGKEFQESGQSAFMDWQAFWPLWWHQIHRPLFLLITPGRPRGRTCLLLLPLFQASCVRNLNSWNSHPQCHLFELKVYKSGNEQLRPSLGRSESRDPGPINRSMCGNKATQCSLRDWNYAQWLIQRPWASPLSRTPSPSCGGLYHPDLALQAWDLKTVQPVCLSARKFTPVSSGPWGCSAKLRAWGQLLSRGT
jgi:hypothetical protein